MNDETKKRAAQAVLDVVVGVVTARAVYEILNAMLGPPRPPAAAKPFIDTTCRELDSTDAEAEPMTLHELTTQAPLVPPLLDNTPQSRHASTIRLPGDPPGQREDT